MLRRSFARFGFEIRHRVPDLADFLIARHVDVVLDAGANVGQFGQWLRKHGYRGEIISFEPVEAAFRELKAVADRDGNWHVHHLALGATASPCTPINVSRDTRFSSILDQTPIAARFDAEAVVLRQEEVAVARLDDLLASFRDRIVFLKSDTQGYERAVIEGARKALTWFVGVQLELPLVHLYQNTWSFEDAITHMRGAGFVLAQLNPVIWRREDPVSLIEVDAVFRRADQ